MIEDVTVALTLIEDGSTGRRNDEQSPAATNLERETTTTKKAFLRCPTLLTLLPVSQPFPLLLVGLVGFRRTLPHP